MKNENGIEKSAILKGQTLVNLCNRPKDHVTLDKNTPLANLNITRELQAKKYAIIGEVSDFNAPNTGVSVWVSHSDGEERYYNNLAYTNGKFVYLLEAQKEITTVRVYIHGDDRENDGFFNIGGLMLLEYQDGMENWDIPYFEGMKSVQMPVLTTTGKNLFGICEFEKGVAGGFPNTNITITNNSISFSEIGGSVAIKLKGKPNTKYTISFIVNNTSTMKLREWNNRTQTTDVNGNVIWQYGSYNPNTNNGLYKLENIQIEQGSVATSYEPYKSNILNTSEDVVLRGIGDVQDTLDCLTDEVTERIGEIVLDDTLSYEHAWGGGRDTETDYVIGVKVNNHLWNVSHETQHWLFKCDKLRTRGITSFNGYGFFLFYVSKSVLGEELTNAKIREYILSLNATVQYPLATPVIKTVDLNILDQDNQPQERMKLFPNGHINTSSSTFPPILELKGITHNNKLNMTTTNGTNNTQLATLDNLVLDGIICRDGTVVRDSYDVESGLYTKRIFRVTIDEEFVERYRNGWQSISNNLCVEHYLVKDGISLPKSVANEKGMVNNMAYTHRGDINRLNIDGAIIYIRLLKEELKSYDVDGLLDWIKRNGAIEVAYQMATPQIIHMQPNMTPYVSTRPYQGSIESQGNILESSYLDYTSEQSIISPKPLGNGDVLRWEQGSQCYVYENDKEYIPLTDYNQPMGTVLDLEEEDGEQYVENLDGGDIVVDVPFKEKAVYERHLVPYKDKVIYPTQDKLDPTGKIEVDYICGETWQNPNDLSDIRHVGTLREDGQYDVTIRRSGDDEIRLLEGTTHIGLDGDGLNPSEFELTYYNKDGVEVGKYGDTSHMLENTLVDGKLETGMVYGDTLVNLVDTSKIVYQTTERVNRDSDGYITIQGLSGSWTYAYIGKVRNLKPDTLYTIIIDVAENTLPGDMEFIQINGNSYEFGRFTQSYYIPSKRTGRIIITRTTKNQDVFDNYVENFDFRIQLNTNNVGKIKFRFIVLEGDYTSYPMDIPYFKGVGSTIVNGFTTIGKNLFDGKLKAINLTEAGLEVASKQMATTVNFIKVSPKMTFSSYGLIGGDMVVVNRFNEYDANKNFIRRKENSLKNPYTYTPTDENVKYITVTFRTPILKDIPLDEFKKIRIQIEHGSTPTEFEPYKGITYNLPTPITLNKVGDVADTYDVVSGVETRNVEKIVLDGSLNYILYPLSDEYPDVIGAYYWFKNDGYFNKTSPSFINNVGMKQFDSDVFPSEIKTNEEGIIVTNGGTYIKFAIKRNKLTSLNEQGLKQYFSENPITLYIGGVKTPQTIQHTLIPSTVETTQEPTFILPQPLRSVPNGICDRLYWDENKGHYCIEKRIGYRTLTGDDTWSSFNITSNGFARAIMGDANVISWKSHIYCDTLYGVVEYLDFLNYRDYIDWNNNPIKECMITGNPTSWAYMPAIRKEKLVTQDYDGFKQWFADNPTTVYYALNKTEIIDLPHLNKKLTLPTQPDTLPIGYKVEYPKANPQLGLTIPYKQLNYPSRPQNIDFKMDIADYVLTWDDVKEARQYNVILNDRVIATVKEPQWNSGEEMYGYIMVEAQNELAENLSEELYIKTVPNAPAQLTVAHNPMTDYYDFEISFIKTSAIAEYYTVQYRIDGGEWVYKTIQSSEIDPNSKVLWRFSVYEISEQIEVWATATNDIGTNDILPTAIYYMSPTPQWTYRINSKELFVRWMDDSPYDTQYKLRYQYKSDGIYRYAYFEGDKQEIGKLYEALIPLADDEEVSIALCIISEKENLYTKPIKASKELDPNIKPPKNFNYHWLARGLIEFYWEDNYDVDVEYEAIVEHRLTSGNNEWITDTRIFSATDTEGTGAVYRLEYQLEDLEEIRVKVRMRWAMNETEWSESLTTVFIPVEGNPPQWIRRTQTQEGLLVEWEAQEYVDSYHVYVMSNGEELQHLETMDNFIYVDIDYSNPIDIEIYEATRFSGGIQSDPSDKMRFRPTMDKHQLIHDVVTPDTLTYEIEVDTVQKGIKERQVIHDINTTPKVTDKQPMDVAIKSPFTLSFHPLQLDVHQAGSKYYGDTELHIKTLDVKSRDGIEILTFERITDQYGVDFTVYTPSASKYPITLEVNRVRIVCFGDSKLRSVC